MFEALEQRQVLSGAAVFDWTAVEITDWISEERIPELKAHLKAITTTNSQAPIYTSTVESLPLIDLDEVTSGVSTVISRTNKPSSAHTRSSTR